MLLDKLAVSNILPSVLEWLSKIVTVRQFTGLLDDKDFNRVSIEELTVESAGNNILSSTFIDDNCPDNRRNRFGLLDDKDFN